jgi:hypothetical protein
MRSDFNIVEEALIDVSSTDFINNDRGFYFHSIDGGIVKYIPWGNGTTVITKTIAGSDDFNRITKCKKIVSSGTTATNIYVGYAE